MSTVWEYTTLSQKDGYRRNYNLLEQLNKLGANGWEVVMKLDNGDILLKRIKQSLESTSLVEDDQR